MLRSFLTFRSFGFDVVPVPSSGLRYLDRTDRTRMVLREYLGLVSYGLLGRFSAQEHGRAAIPIPQPVSQEVVQSGNPTGSV
jgi:hypothetical protein